MEWLAERGHRQEASVPLDAGKTARELGVADKCRSSHSGDIGTAPERPKRGSTQASREPREGGAVDPEDLSWPETGSERRGEDSIQHSSLEGAEGQRQRGMHLRRRLEE